MSVSDKSPHAAERMLSDSIEEMLRLLESARERARVGGEYEAGEKMGLAAALSVLQQQAQAFGIPTDSLSLPSVDILAWAAGD